MPLAYETRRSLTFPDRIFSADDIAVIVVTGARYGGQWSLSALVVQEGGPSDDSKLGEIFTAENPDPQQAVDTAYVWVNDACVSGDVKLAHFENKNSTYGPDEAPYFASALFLIDRRK